MDLWDSYKKRSGGAVSSARMSLGTGERWNASIGRVAEKGVVLDMNNAFFQHYDENRRYILAKDITHDLLMTVYDVNLSSIFVARMSQDLDGREFSRIVSLLKSVRMPNFEFRFIGLQNGYVGSVKTIDEAKKRLSGRFIEFDLFGNDTRHIVVDTKTGVPYNLLLLNRIYRAGELACQVRNEDFEQKKSKLAFL